MNCPKCKLINPENAIQCDCGYNFQTKEMQQLTHPVDEANESTIEQPKEWPAKVGEWIGAFIGFVVWRMVGGIWGFVIGLVAGMVFSVFLSLLLQSIFISSQSQN